MRAGWGRPSPTSGEDGGAGSRARDGECSPSPCWASAAWSARCSSARRASSPPPKRAGRRSSPPWAVGRSRSCRSRWTRGGSRRRRRRVWEAGWEQPTIVFVGRADDPRKNIALLLDAFALVLLEHPTARLRLVGTPPRRPVPPRVEVVGEVAEVAPVPSRRDDLRPPVVAGGLRHRGGGSPFLRDPGRDDTLRWARGHRPTVGGRHGCDGVLRRGDGGRAPPPAREPGDAPGLQDVGSDLRRPGARAGDARAAAETAAGNAGMTAVTAVIGNYEGAALLPDCLRSLRDQTQPPIETIVVDASSSDQSTAVAAAHGCTVIVRPNDGLGALYNAGARAASSPYVLLANNDVAFDERCVELLAEQLDADERRFAADPRQMDWSGTRLVHARATISRGPLLRVPLPGLPPRPRGARRAPSSRPCPRTAAPCSSGASGCSSSAASTRRCSWTSRTSTSAGARGCAAGPACTCPTAFVRHHVGAVTSPGPVLTRRLGRSHHNLMRFALKCFPAARRGERRRRRASAAAAASATHRAGARRIVASFGAISPRSIPVGCETRRGEDDPRVAADRDARRPSSDQWPHDHDRAHPAAAGPTRSATRLRVLSA